MELFSNLFKKKAPDPILVMDDNGRHQLGGQATKDFIMPGLETAPMIYLGLIKKDEDLLVLLDFDLNLVCPIFLDLRTPIFLDYSDPFAPLIIIDNVDTNFHQYFDDIHASDNIVYQSINFKFDYPSPKNVKLGVHNISMTTDEIGVAGKPNWMHGENWPCCPKTGNRMKFLFQLSDLDACKTIEGQEVLEKESIAPYLNFGHGYLYIFYEPESKVIAYLNQL